jgi:hypothetical protein
MFQSLNTSWKLVNLQTALAKFGPAGSLHFPDTLSTIYGENLAHLL